MPRHRKHFVHGTVVEVTFRVEVGLPFVQTSYMRLIVESYLARAQYRYPITICAVVVMGNHVHMLLVVKDPEAVPKFLEYFKRETAHAVNRLWGRHKQTVWCEGYDSPVVLDAAKVVQRLVYFYTNPQRARLVDTIEEYGQFHTWKEFLSGSGAVRVVPCFPRFAVPTLTSVEHACLRDAAQQIYDLILTERDGDIELLIEPFAWMACFASTEGITTREVIDAVLQQVRSAEGIFVAERGSATQALGFTTDTTFRPRKWGRRMICLGSERSDRAKYIQWFLHAAAKAKLGIQDWMVHHLPLKVPPGFFAPGGKLFANIIPKLSVSAR